MSATSETTYTWHCDMCGKDAGTNQRENHPPDSLTRLEVLPKGSVDRGFSTIHISGKPGPVDLCADCMQRPIAELAEFVNARAKAAKS